MTYTKNSHPFTVTCVDTFMSGWGRAKGLTNELHFLCANRKEAEIVKANAEARSDMKKVAIQATVSVDCGCIPVDEVKGERRRGNLLIQVKTRREYPSWYREGYFSKDDE